MFLKKLSGFSYCHDIFRKQWCECKQSCVMNCSLSDIFQIFCDKLQHIELTSKLFGELCNDEERFKFTYDLFMDNCSLQMDKSEKSKYKSTQFRNLGNEKFVKKLDWQALELYTLSIACAPSNSEELCLAFGNRASCLLSLGLSSLALEDVNRALRLSPDSTYTQKLYKRKEKCLEKVVHDDDSDPILSRSTQDCPPLGRERNTYILSASSVVQQKYSKEMGRHLVAQNNVTTGEVLIIEKPYSSILLPSHYYTHCAYCFQRSFTLIPCFNCSTTMFCSQTCYNASMKESHIIECSVLQFLVNIKVWRMELLALRILINATKQGAELRKLYDDIANNSNSYDTSIYSSDDHINIYNLMGNTDLRSIADLFKRSVTACIIVHALVTLSSFFTSVSDTYQSEMKIFVGGLLLRYMQSLPCNAHEISEFCEEGLCEIGAGAYATLSLINHSCDPNVVRHSYEDKVVLTAIRPIKAGEQLFDNYGYHYATNDISERQFALKKQYFFECRCEACLNNWPQYENIPSDFPVFKNHVNESVKALYKKQTEEFEENLEKVLSGEFTDDMVQVLSNYLDFLDSVVERPWQKYNKCQEAIKHCLSFKANHFRFSKGVLTK